MTELPSLLVGVPVLARPQNAAPLVDNLIETTPSAALVFLYSPGDSAEEDACEALLSSNVHVVPMIFPAGPGDFAKKHNFGFLYAYDSDYDFYFVGADDLTFHPGWYEACLDAHAKTGACVIGTRDLGNQRTMNGWHSTHFLVHRDYLECGTIDEAGILLHEGYDHQFCDDECIQTARWRRTYAASQAVVEHRHPHWGKAAMDATYEKALRATHADQALYESRRHMFGRGRSR